MITGLDPDMLLAMDDDAARVAALAVGTCSDAALADHLDVIGPVVQRDAAVALPLLIALADEAGRRSLDGLEAGCRYLGARALVHVGRLADAVEAIDRARSLWLRSGDTLQALRTDLGRMAVMDDLGRHADAIIVGRALVAAIDEDPDVDEGDEQVVWLRAACLENLGVSHGFLGAHDEALAAYEAAEAVYRAHGWAEDVPRPMANRAVELIALERLEEAIELLTTARALFAEHGDSLSVAKTYADAGHAELARGNFVGAAAAIEAAERHLSDQGATTEYARVQLLRAKVLASLNLLDESEALFTELVEQFSDAGLDHDAAEARFGVGVALAQSGREREADQALADAVDAFAAVGDDAMQAMVLLQRSLVVDEPRALVEQASALAGDQGRPSARCAILLRMAQIESSPAAADAHLGGAEALIDHHGLPHLRWEALHLRGVLQRTAGDVDAARASLEAAALAIEDLRSTVVDEYYLLPFMRRRRRVHEALIDLLIAEGDIEAAFERTEFDRARTLEERLTGQIRGFEVAPAPASLESLYAEVFTSPMARAGDAAAEARAIERTLGMHVGGSARADSAASIPDLGTASITYQLLGDDIVAFVRAGDELRLERRIGTVVAVERLLRRLDAQWRRFADRGLAARRHPQLHASTVDVLQQLHLQLLAPIAGALEADSLLVVPTGPIGNVPFHALHDGTSHLIERMSVSIAPSLRVAARAATRTRAGTRRLVIGVPDAYAPMVAEEAAAIGVIGSGATVLVGEDASTDAITRHIDDHDVLHFACHAMHRPDNPLFSALLLGDRWLTAAEVVELRLDGQLVVLSACESGRQLGADGRDELVGLPRAFLAAGAGGVVVNLWKADDASSVGLMTRFHEELEDHAPATALRTAQLAGLERDPHPYGWAPGVLVGAPFLEGA